jgi:putative ABC transport system permease protein
MIDLPSTLTSSFKISFRALRVNKMRSALTMLGIIIGVMAVITMLAVGAGAREAIISSISSIGSNLLIVIPGAETQGGARAGPGLSRPTLTTGDVAAILRECPAVEDVAPLSSGVAHVVFGPQQWSTIITGSSPSLLNIRDWKLSSGRAFTEQESETSSDVALLGQTVVNTLFGEIDPVGQLIRIKDMPFRVVGVLEPKGQSIIGQDQDDTIIIPISTVENKLFGNPFPGTVHIIMIKARSAQELDEAQDEVTRLLRQRHHILENQDDDFSVKNLTQIMEIMETATRIMTILLGAIAGISLLVGGIGIMNIMLVSVTERTREIGIRMAVGAKIMDIRLQFIIEAMTLTMIGGAIGIFLGIVIAQIISHFSGWPVIVSVSSVFLGFGFSALVGIFFGFYPAYKASLLNPIDALRYE